MPLLPAVAGFPGYGYWVICPPVVMAPMALTSPWVNHNLPSSPAAMMYGDEPGVIPAEYVVT